MTRGHFDHVADAVALARRTNAKVIANFEIAEWLGAEGLKTCTPSIWAAVFSTTSGMSKLTPALHGSMLPDGSNGGMPNGFLLTLGEKRIYFAGDTALFSDMKLIGRQPIDLAVSPIGDNFTMGPEGALLALEFLQPKVVIPAHYNTWDLLNQDAAAWAEKVQEKRGPSR